LPRIAMMECAVMLERSPVTRDTPPLKVNVRSPIVHATRSLA